MNRLHLILVAVLDTAQEAGGLHQDHAEAIFNALSDILAEVPDEAVTHFEENVKRILAADVP
jgi:hypothetical protein